MGLLDRLEFKGIVERKANEKDGRSHKIILTLSGSEFFEHAFPNHMQHLEKAFNQLSPQ